MTLTTIGWGWQYVGKSLTIHLCPPTILRQSRTACGRLPLYGERLEIPIAFLWGAERYCQRCKGRES